jgi:plasmid stability protein
MSIDLEKLPDETRGWLDQRARRHGTSPDLEAVEILDSAVRERMRRERLFEAAAQARICLPGPPLTAAEIDEITNWGRD